MIPEAPKWVSYNGVVDYYERYHVLRGYALVARDLVIAMAIPGEAIVLDVGTGTGEAAFIVRAWSGARVVIGIDPSYPMLRAAAKKGLKLVVAGKTPGLPFRSEQFDAVMATLVLSHFENYEEALADMVRVLKPGGKFGVTAWAARSARPAEAADLWRSVAESFEGAEALRGATKRITPWEDWFTDPGHLTKALIGAGLSEVRLERREYRVSITAAEYLSRMESSGWGRFMSGTLDSSRWAEFQSRVAEVFAKRLARRFNIFPSSHLAIGTK